jgi:ribonuclease HI
MSEPNKPARDIGKNKTIADPASSALRKEIQEIIIYYNSLDTMPNHHLLLALQIGGRDEFTSKRIKSLKELAGQEASEYVEEKIAEDITSKKDKYQAIALRWMLRGLAMDIAVEKAIKEATIPYHMRL